VLLAVRERVGSPRIRLDRPIPDVPDGCGRLHLISFLSDWNYEEREVQNLASHCGKGGYNSVLQILVVTFEACAGSTQWGNIGTESRKAGRTSGSSIT